MKREETKTKTEKTNQSLKAEISYNFNWDPTLSTWCVNSHICEYQLFNSSMSDLWPREFFVVCVWGAALCTIVCWISSLVFAPWIQGHFHYSRDILVSLPLHSGCLLWFKIRSCNVASNSSTQAILLFHPSVSWSHRNGYLLLDLAPSTSFTKWECLLSIPGSRISRSRCTVVPLLWGPLSRAVMEASPDSDW